MPRILLVEDNEMNRDMLSRRLGKRGYEVLLAADAETALVAAVRDTPDLILMDVGLPGMDGWTATRVLKAASSTSAIPVIALTAHAMSGDREMAQAAGCDGYETKPVDFANLIAKIQELLAPRR